jgi:hypothetical protein
VMLLGEAKREAPAQAKLRPTCAGASPGNPSTCPIKIALMGLKPWAKLSCPLRVVGQTLNTY